MASRQATQLAVQPRTAAGSRAVRRMRREGLVPGVVYGGDGDAQTFQVGERDLRQALADAGAVIELALEGADSTPVVVKDEQRHPVNGRLLHVDLLRVRLDRPIQATTILELDGAEESPGVKEGGILEQVTRELNVEALPAAIPDVIRHDVSGMEMNDTLTLEAIAAPEGVTLLDDLAETVVANLSPPRVEEEPELEEETELVGDEEAAEGEAEGEGEAQEPAEGAGEPSGDDE
jgi:large subunit ribosomal protein L25